MDETTSDRSSLERRDDFTFMGLPVVLLEEWTPDCVAIMSREQAEGLVEGIRALRRMKENLEAAQHG